MTEILNFILSLMVSYGYPIIVMVVLLGEFGLPLPVSTILLAAGSLTIDGTFSFINLVLVSTLAAIFGDVSGYYVGKYVGTKKSFITKRSTILARKYLDKWGATAIFTTRWLFTPLCVPTNLAAGMARYPFNKFIVNVILGETLWTLIYVYLGYVFGINWQSLQNYLGSAPLIVTLLLLAFAVPYLFKKYKIRRKKYKTIQQEYLSP